jgi:hypothetical protein
MQLAELSVDTFNEAASIEFDCLGAYQKAWIRSYGQADDSGTLKGQCVALYLGATADAGAAALPLYCDVPAAVLCQLIPGSVI